MGKIYQHFGVKGWVKIVSYTRPTSEIFQYDSWMLVGLDDAGRLDDPRFWLTSEVSAFKQHAKGWVVKLADYDSREASQRLIGRHIGIDRSRFKPLAKGDYYWLDLIGLSVVNLEGVILGKVDHLIETGANDVMVVRSESSPDDTENADKERLLPWITDVVTRVDFESGVITVDWKEDY